eukprot:403356050
MDRNLKIKAPLLQEPHLQLPNPALLNMSRDVSSRADHQIQTRRKFTKQKIMQNYKHQLNSIIRSSLQQQLLNVSQSHAHQMDQNQDQHLKSSYGSNELKALKYGHGEKQRNNRYEHDQVQSQSPLKSSRLGQRSQRNQQQLYSSQTQRSQNNQMYQTFQLHKDEKNLNNTQIGAFDKKKLNVFLKFFDDSLILKANYKLKKLFAKLKPIQYYTKQFNFIKQWKLNFQTLFQFNSKAQQNGYFSKFFKKIKKLRAYEFNLELILCKKVNHQENNNFDIQSQNKIGLTQRTKQTNEEMSEYLEKLQQAELNQDNNFPKNLDKIDCKQLIFQTNREIKTLNYKLLRIIATENIHQNINIGRPTEIEVIEEQPAYLKLNPKGYRSPAIFTINFRGETAKRQIQDLKIYVNRFIFRCKEDDKFENNEQIYIAFSSMLGCSLTLSVTFPHEIMEDFIGGVKRKIVTIKQKQINENGQEVEVEVEHDLKDIEENFEVHDLQMRRTRPENYVNKNKIQMKEWNIIREKKINAIKSQIDDQKLKAISKKLEQENYERKKKYFLLHKWKIIKIKKQEMMGEKFEELQKLGRCSELAKLVLIDKIIRFIYGQFDKHRKFKHFLQKRIKCSERISRFYKQKIQLKGQTIDDRMQRILIESFTFSGQFEIEKNQLNSKEILKDLLSQTAEEFRIKGQFRLFYNKVVHIQNEYRDRIQSFKNRIAFLTEYWEREKINITKSFVSNKKHAKKLKPYITKLTLLNQKVRETFIKEYFSYCMNNFHIKYINWRQQKLKFMKSLNVEDKSQEIRNLQKQVKLKSVFLFEGIEQFLEELIQQYIQQQQMSQNISLLNLTQSTSLHSQASINTFLMSPNQKSQQIGNAKQPQLSPAKFNQQDQTQNSSTQGFQNSNNSGNQSREGTTKNLRTKKQVSTFKQATTAVEQQKEAEDPGPPPILIFMPKRIQLIKMILKAINYEQPEAFNL